MNTILPFRNRQKRKENSSMKKSHFAMVFSILLSFLVGISLSAEPWCQVNGAGSVNAPASCGYGQTITVSGTTPSADTAVEYMWLWNTTNNYADGNQVQLGTSTSPDYSLTVYSSGWVIRCARPQGCGWSWSQAKETGSNYISVNQCSAIISAVTTVDVSSCGASNGKLNVDPNVNGGTVLPFEIYYTFNGQEHYGGGGYNDYSNNYVTGLEAGSYTDVRIVDANGCEDAKWGPFVINQDCSGGNMDSPNCQLDCSGINTNIPNYMYLGSFNGHVYYKRTSGDVEYWTAESYANELGGYLVTINSQEENDWLKNNVGGQFWIGLTDAGSEGNFYWANGEPSTYTNWASGEPNDWNGGQDYTKFYTNGTWNDVNDNSYEWAVIEVVCPCNPVSPMEPTCSVSVDAGDDKRTCPGDHVTLTASVSGANDCSCCERNVSNTHNCGNGSVYGIYLEGQYFELSEATWEECSDGTARFMGSAWNNNDDITFDIHFSGQTSNPPAGSPKDNNCGATDPWGWEYYTSTSGTITSNHHGTFNVAPTGPAFQVGDGANQTGMGLGGSGWITLSGGDGFYDNGDINIMLGALNCSNNNNGNITYAWSNGSTGQSITVNPSMSQTYVVTVTDCAGCSATDEVTVEVEVPQAVIGTVTDPACGETNGSVTITFTDSPNRTAIEFSTDGGNTYGNSVNDNSGSTTIALAPGTYSLWTRWGNDDCPVEIGPVTISPASVPSVTASNNGPLTCTMTDVQISASATGVSSYSWTGPNGFTSTMATMTVTAPGTYTVTVTSTTNCTAMASTTVASNTNAPSVTASNNGPLTCDMTSIQLSATATAGATYSWTGPNGFTSAMQNPNAAADGTYTVTVTGANGCTATASTTVAGDTSVPTVTASNNGPLTCTTTNVTLTANATNANSYSWTGPNGFTSSQANPTATNPGTYTVVIEAGNGCTAMATTTIAEDVTPPTVSATNDGPITCTVTSAQLTATATGAATYSWTGPNGFTSSQANPIVTVAGTYNVTVTGANGCTANSTTTVASETNPPSVTASNDGPFTCTNVAVELTATSANAASYSWSGPNNYASNQQNPTVNGPGTYTVIVTGDNGCTATASTTITSDTTDPSVTASNDGPLTCDLTSIALSATSADAVSYSWIGPNGFTSAMANPSVGADGTYIVTVTAANGCTANASTVVTVDADAPTVSASNDGPLTCIKTDVVLTASSAGAISYSWMGPAGFTSAMQNPTVSTPGTYMVTIEAANGCTAIASTIVTEDVTPPAIISVANDGPLTCTMTIVQLTSSVTGALGYSWAGPNGFTSSQPNPIVSVAGTYTLTVMGANGCTAMASTIVAEDVTPPTVSTTNDGPLTCDMNNVQLTVTSADAVSYSWTGPDGYTSTMENPTVGADGTYIVTITGANGCTAMANTTVTSDTNIPMVTASKDGDLTCGVLNVALTATATNAISYSWVGPNGFVSTDANPTITEAGTYTVTVEAANGCTAMASVDVIFEACQIDLELAKVVNQDTVNVGDTVVWTISVINKGPDDATGVTVTDVLPIGVSAIGATTVDGTFDVASLTWDIGNVALNQTVLLDVSTIVNIPGTWLNTAQIATADQMDIDSFPGDDDGDQDENDEDDEDDEDNAMITGLLVDLEVAKTADVTEVIQGDTITYTILVANEGPSIATGVSVSDQLPAEVTYVASSADQGAYDATSGIWTVGTIPVNDTLALTLTVVATGAGDACNIAQVNSVNEADVDSDPANDDGDQSEDDEDKVNVMVLAGEYDLALIKELAPDQAAFVNLGEEVSFTITVANQGNLNSGNYTITDQIPAGMSFVSASDGGTHNNGIVTWNLSNLGENATITVTLALLVDELGTGKFVNWAEISADSGDDSDSTPDADTGNDFTNPNDAVDNHNDITLDEPANDEDDNDFEEIFVDRGSRVAARVNLQGAMMATDGAAGNSADGMMRDNLRQDNVLPMSEPYTALPNFDHVGGGGGEIVDAAIYELDGAHSAVDWVLVELRDPANPSNVLATRSALLLRNGHVVDIDGVSDVGFPDIEEGTYYVAIRHRNHLGVMTAGTVQLNADYSQVVDFRDPNTPTYGEHAQKDMNGSRALWAGNSSGTNSISFQGAGNEPNITFFEVLLSSQNTTSQATYIVEGYNMGDTDMNCESIYQGPNNDPGPVFFNVLTHPENFNYLTNFSIMQQLP